MSLSICDFWRSADSHSAFSFGAKSRPELCCATTGGSITPSACLHIIKAFVAFVGVDTYDCAARPKSRPS